MNNFTDHKKTLNNLEILLPPSSRAINGKTTGVSLLFSVFFLFISFVAFTQPGIDTVTMQPKLIFRGESSTGGYGVGGCGMDITNESLFVPYSNSAISVCEDGIAEMEMSYDNAIGENQFIVSISGPSNAEGVTAFDLVYIQQYTLGKTTLDNYEFIAGDANEDGVLDSIDIDLWRQVILQPTSYWPPAPYWLIVHNPNIFDFEAAPQNITLYNHTYDSSSSIAVIGDPSDPGIVNNIFSFRMIKKGDVNGSTCYSCWNGCPYPASLLQIEDYYVDLSAKEVSEIKLYINHPGGLAGMKWILGYDQNDIEILEVRSDLPGFSDKDFFIDDGELRIMYLEPGSLKNSPPAEQSYIEISVVSKNKIFSKKKSRLSTLDLEIIDRDLNEISDVSLGLPENNYRGTSQTASFRFFPNPVQNELNTLLVSDEKQYIQIQLVDMQGRIIYSDNWLMKKGENQFSVDFSGFASGIYFLHGLGEKGMTFQQKIVK